MANNSPTLVMASLSDDQLKKSIDSLVTHVDEAMKKMVQSTNNAVGEMEAKLKSLGNLKIDSGGSADGGASKRAKAQNAETDAVEKTITARGKQIKQNQEAAMSFDQIAAALDKARRTVSDFNTKRASGILPSSDDYKRYEQALARIVEYNDKLKQSALGKAFGNERAFAFDAKRVVSDITAVDERLKQLGKYYAELEKQSQKTSSSINKQLEDEVGRRNIVIEQMRAYYKEQERLSKEAAKIQNKEFREQFRGALSLPANDILDAYRKIDRLKALLEEMRAKKKDKIVDISETDINRVSNAITSLRSKIDKMYEQRAKAREKETAAQKKLIDDQYKLAFARTMKIPTDQLDLARAKLERLQALLRDMRERGILSNTQIASTETEIRKLEQIIGQVNTAQQQATQSAQRYTEEIRKQAAAIRATKEWQEKGHVVVGDINYYDKERANVSKRDKQLLLSLEEQIVQAQQNEAEAARKAAQETRNQAQAQQQVQQSALGTARIVESVHEMQKRSASFSKGNASIPTFTVELESAKRLSDRLKELREQYSNMNFGQRFSKEGQVVAQQIREITRHGQILNNQLNRPTKKEVFGLSEKTLDDIAYKMRQLASYRSGLNATTQMREISSVNDEYNRLKKRMDEVMQKNQQMIASNTALGRSWNYMKNRLAFYFTVGVSAQFVKNLIEVRSQYEMNERALGILINSAERGTQIFNELSQMALVSPYTLIELSSAAKQLTAYDIAAKDVVNTTRRLADMAAAVGIPIERLTYALGQVKAYGYLNARDARMFANAGIPLVKNLSEYYTELEGRLVSTADIYDRIKKKQIGYEEVMSTISKMTDEGGKFFDFQAKMAETLKVQLANLTLAWNNMLNDMGEESQGVLVGGIGALKQMFLHWKDIEHILTEVVVALGAYKAYQLVTTRLMGVTSASLDAQILAMKRNNAAMLEKQSLTRKLTYDEAKLIATQNQLTAADYKNALSGKNLTKQKALLLVALNKNNVQLKAAIVNMGLLTAQEAANITTGRALAIVFKSIGISIRNAAMAMKAFMVSNWWILALGGIYELYHAWDGYNEHVAEVNRSAAEHAKEAFENIKTYLEGDVINTLQETLKQGGKVSSDAEGQKAWDEMREKIELSSSASNVFIARLMQIDDINERLSAGFDYLNNIQRVAGVMQTLGDDAIKVSTTTLGGLFGEGVKDDLNDFVDAYQKYVNLNENLRQSGVGEEYFNEQKRALEEFRSEVEKTTTSLYNIASKEGFNINEQREFFERGISETAQAEQMGIKETRIYRMQAEQEYYAYAKAQLEEQLQYQQGEQKAATERRLQELQNEFGSNKAMQESFFTWLTEKQDHAVKNMLRGKTQEEIKQGDWLKGANGKWVEEMARKFSKEYGVSFDDLHRLVMNANTWSINIPVFFQTIGQPLTDVQRDYEARTGKKFSSNYLIKDAKSQVEILDILKKKQKEVAQEMETSRKAGGQYWEDNKKRYKEENDALVADIHAYNALTDAEEKANKKSGKGGSKKDPLLDALKQEISLVEKLQGDYDKLSKSGASQADALDTIRGAYGKTIRLLNAQLQSYGLPQIDISQLITGKDPNKALAHFKQTLDTLVSKGMLTLERSKELEAVVEKFTLSAKTYNLDMITKGLNSELGKLKDEYELAVELDANPELGDMFADFMGINMNELPKTFQEATKKAQEYIDKVFQDNGRTDKIDIASMLNRESFDKWVEDSGLKMDSELVKSVEAFRQYLYKTQVDEAKKQIDEWNKLLEKYAEYEYKKKQIRKQYERELETARKKGADENIIAAITNRYNQENAKLDFEQFQTTPQWITATGDLAGLTHKALGMLIDDLVEYKKKAKNLNPKQIKEINRALRSLYKEQRKNNPFLSLANAMDEAADRASVFQEEIDNSNKELLELEINRNQENIADVAEKIDKLRNKIKKLNEEKDKAGKVDVSVYTEWFNSIISLASNAADSISDMMNALAGKNGSGDAKSIKDMFDILGNAGQWAAIGGQLGGAYGAIIGGAFGAVTSVVTKFADEWSGNADITDKVEESERAVKRLEIAYVDLENAMKKAYGTSEIGAKKAVVFNKELQRQELQRQLKLEESRKAKNKDYDKILDLKKQIKELEYDIIDSINEITYSLLGITSVGSAAETLVSSMIAAFKKGERFMDEYKQSFDDMIDNMIMKSIVSNVIGQRLQDMFDRIQKTAEDRASSEKEAYEKAAKDYEQWLKFADNKWFEEYYYFDPKTFNVDRTKVITREEQEKLWKERLEYLLKQYENALTPTTEDVQSIRNDMDNWREGVKEEFLAYMDAFGVKYGQDSTTNLSALQQGIQGITEDTAGAIEAYMNGVSQQVYLHSDLLTQIRDAVVGFDMDVQTATMGEILLQLRSSYEVQMAIHGILEGVLNPSGRAFSVELLS